ncbi:MAG TPA: hypothetical protein VF187_08805, partial [Gemmatimonadales bacterium]
MRSFRAGALALLLPALPALLPAQERAQNGAAGAAAHAPSRHAIPSPMVAAGRRTMPVTLDGRLDDQAWTTVQPATDFRQAQPKPGDAATQKTEIRLL